MKKFAKHKSYQQIKAQCEAQGVPLFDKLFVVDGADSILVGCLPSEPYGHVIYNTTNGRFFGKTDKGVEFSSDSAQHDGEPWMQALLAFFYEGPTQ